METYIAIDIGASSGRLMKSSLADGKISLEEVHRFKNGFERKDGCDRWKIDYLIQEILIGLEKLKRSGVDRCHVGIDTWAVDYCLLDKDGQRLADPVAYRDKRTNQVMPAFAERFPLQRLYEKTGIQMQPFNTIFQLFVEERKLLAAADKLLLIPDYLGYVFTGRVVTEKTNASTMQLLNVHTQDWDDELLELIGVSRKLFPSLTEAGTILGRLKREKFPAFDLPEATFVTVATHDTASAVIGTPGQGDGWAYLSSGTWSLLGTERYTANAGQNAFLENYTNEWGACHTIRFLKNIMGMWLIQEVARAQDYRFSYAELAELAAAAPAFQHIVDVNDDRFLNPTDMIQELQSACRESGQGVPETPGEIARCVYDSLALCYASELAKLTQLTGSEGKLSQVHIVGGGANNHFLNQLTADTAGIEVFAGPSEATAIGNIIMQMVATGMFSSIKEGRQYIRASFDCQNFLPEHPVSPEILENYQNFLKKKRKEEIKR